MSKSSIRWFLGALAVMCAFAPAVSVAQEASFAEKKQVEIKGNAERTQVERKTLEQEEGAGPKVSFETDEMAAAAVEADKLELQAQAIKKLQLRIKNTDEDDPNKPALMERLGDMLWQKAKYYDLRSYDFLNKSYEAEDRGDAEGKAKALEQKAADEKTSRAARDEMLKLYKEIIKYYPDYEQIDKIRYYMAFNLAEMGYAGEAYEQYSGIVREHSNSKYLAEAFLGMAEYTFTIEEDMPLALQQYQKVVSIDKSSSAASFAMYKMGWCYFNLGEPKRALAQFEKVIRESDAATTSNRRSDMRKEALKDLVKAYSMWDEAKPANAKKYFKSFAADDEEVNNMMERLARLYSEGGRVNDSIYVYNQLIKDNMGKFKIVDYQYEIMLNIDTMGVPEKTAQEIRRTVELYVMARNENYEGATPEAVKAMDDKLEQYTRETAKFYHVTYQTTKNAIYYSLAFEIYKTYLDNFPNAQDNYEIMYYYADMAYFRGNYATAAKSYERALDLNENGEFSKDAAHGAVLAYEKLMKSTNEEDKAACPDIPETPEAAEGEEQEYPEYEIAECRLNFIKASKRYAKIDTSAEFAINAKYMAAQIYFDYNHFDEAKPLFLEITHENPEHELAVLSANYLLDSYKARGEYEGMSKAIADLKGNSAFMSNKSELMPEFVSIMNTYEEALDFKFCEEKDKKRLWEDAAKCYENFAATHKGSEDAPKALWNASIAWENGSEISRAIETRAALLSSSDTSEEMKALALYQIASNYHSLAVYSEAARFYELFVKKYPDNHTACVPIGAEPKKDPCAKDALQNAAVFRSGLGEYEKAIENFDLFAKMFPKDKNEMSMLKFQTGRIYFDQKKYDSAIDRFNDYLRNYAKLGTPGRSVAAKTYIGKAYWAKKNRKEALKYFQQAENDYFSNSVQKWLETADPADQDQARNAAAEARFMRGEALFQETLEIKLSDPSVPAKKIEKYLQDQIVKKSNKMQEAAPIYNDVITKFKSPKWGLAAMARIGMMYHDTAYQIENAPTPPGLPEEVELVYVEILLDFSAQFEERAVAYYEAAVKKAAETGWFSEFTNEAQKRLFVLRPDQYRSASEVKATPSKTIETYHTGTIFTDLEELRGKVSKTKRVVNTIAEEETAAADAAAEPVADAAAAQPAADAAAAQPADAAAAQ